jgi:hypothetical protein
MIAIKWLGHYVVDLSKNRPYTDDVEKAKKWTTKGRAELYLRRKDSIWASQCVIVEV